MNRTDLQQLSEIRLREAQHLCAGGLWSGAYYLAGYSVECALKACIAKKVQLYDFPDKKTVTDSYSHDLTRLVEVAQLRALLDQTLAANADLQRSWNVVKDWSEQARYEVYAESDARDLLHAVGDGQKGMLQWLEAHW